MIRIKVPATSANIGVGFDALGLAVSFYGTVYFDTSDEKLEIVGCPKKYQNDHNLIYLAFKRACKYIKKPVPNLKIIVNNDIPIARGLGSSAVCIVAGLKGASVWFENALSDEEILNIATKMEGHPDNVSPAIYGGMCASINDDGDIHVAQYEINKKLNFIAMIPNYPISTHAAREVLPDKMSYADAIYQIGHLGVLIKALELGDFKMIQSAIVDRMHEPYRKALIPDYDKIAKICKDNNSILYISGSGSTLMAISKEENIDNLFDNVSKEFPNWQVKPLTVDTVGATAEIV
ncbi:homoserine kinase [Companilactobacillus hulinensis]|uniref:homoserine kinase n=1 Tax=Companilactobacillus hulinensis TaxID=2486007 RepID=UPI000F7B7488|nr:homoserine kinase [Companilactobacillus hulinensis]